MPRNLLVYLSVGLACGCAGFLLAQTPASTPQLWIGSALVGDTAFKTGLVRIGSGLKLAANEKGERVLSLDLPNTHCTQDINGNTSCVSGDLSYPIPRLTSVHGEAPARVDADVAGAPCKTVLVLVGDGVCTRWQLAHTPTGDGVSCARNGLHQQPGTDYTLAGSALVSGFWQADDAIVCDYQWAQ